MPHFAVGQAPITSCSMAIGLPFAVEPDLDLLVGQGPGEVHLHVVFAGKDQLHRLADSLGRRDRRDHHVRLQPAPEAAAQRSADGCTMFLGSVPATTAPIWSCG